MPRVVELTSYPIKGCAGIPLTEALMTRAGLAHDRSFMVVGENGVFRSQRRDPRLAVIRPEITADGGQLTFHAPDVDAIRIDVDRTSARVGVELFGTAYEGIDQGGPVADWLSDVLGTPSRLVRVPPEHARVTDGLTPGTSGYADSSPVHILSVSSLEALNRRIAESGASPLPMTRFRPNIVVDGWDEPHGEDRARRIGIGNAELGYAKLAIRCAVTLVDQSSGGKAGPEPLRTLARYRRAAEGGVAFGSKFSVVRTGKLAVGDAVIVSAWDG
ncbi:MOSC N-terminal beta barrel domain-containing protein [Streptomyces sp. NPDC005408]|uniref:MOSC domain-containing protein n=1 Tax=Streptomyces sp. NPDC005408 TaxID=3155341 RepID=UPI0033B4B9DD